MSLESWQARYPVINRGYLEKLSLREVVVSRLEEEPREFVWSARLSSGLFGLPDCPAGNFSYAPKGGSEVMLALGDEGLQHLIDFGFLPCPTCHPENIEGFWEKAKDAILFDYFEIDDEKQFLDRNLLPFDAMRVNWERLAPMLDKMPNRIYTQPNLNEEVLTKFKQKIEALGFPLPPIGFYDRTSATRFTEYTFK